MRETMKELRQRTDEVSDLERSMSTMQWDMREVRDTLNKVTSSVVTITEGNETRDKKLDVLIASLSTGLAEREKKTDQRISTIWKGVLVRGWTRDFQTPKKESARLKKVREVQDTLDLVHPRADGVPPQRT